MRIVLASALFFTAGSCAVHAEVYFPPPKEQKAVEAAVADNLLYPDRARFSLIRSNAPAGTSGSVVCGYVTAIEQNGFRGEMRAFNGTLYFNDFGDASFSVTMIAQSELQQMAAEVMCEQDGLGVTATTEAMKAVNKNPTRTASKEEQSAMEQADGLRRRCSGAEGADPSSGICEKSAEAQDRMKEAGWCRGRKDQAAYKANWHRCGPFSE